MKKVEEYGLDLALLVAAIEAQNVSDKAVYRITVADRSGEDLLALFMAAVHAVPAEDTKLLPEATRTFYNGLPDEVFTDVTTEIEAHFLLELKAAAEAGVTPGAPVEEKHDCPSFGGQNAAEPDCQDCKNEFPDEFAACTTKTEANVAAASTKGKKGGKKAPKAPKAPKEPKAPKAPKEPKAPKAPKEPKPPKEKVVTKRSRYGHIVGSMSGDIDQMVFQGAHIDVIAKVLAERHGRELSAARAKTRGHVNHLIQNKGVTVTEVEGILKAQVEFGKGLDATNTSCEAIVLPDYVPPTPAPVVAEGAVPTVTPDRVLTETTPAQPETPAAE